MLSKSMIGGAVIAITINAALAGANDYTFEPVKAELKKGDTTVAVRLIHKPSGKPVADAVIIQTQIDMAPEGMAQMTSPMSPQPGTDPGVYAFKTELPMAGRWLLSIAAKVQGEPETVVGKITYKVNE